MDGKFYSKGYTILRKPLARTQENGLQSVTLGFRICDINPDLPRESVAAIVELLNLGQETKKSMETTPP